MIASLSAVLLCSFAFAGPPPPAPAAGQVPAPAAAPPVPAPQAASPAPKVPAAAPPARASRPASSRTSSPSLVHASTAAADSGASALGASTYTVSTLYTGDRVRDPFLPPAMGGGLRARDRSSSAVDIHALELRGIMKDSRTDFAIFSTDTGGTLMLRGGRLFDERNKRVPGIVGRIMLKQKRAELITTDKDVQIFSLTEPDAGKSRDSGSDESGETGSGRSP